MNDKIERIKKLAQELSVYDDSYYNYDKSLVSDKVYDNKYFELKKLEEETGFILSYSPTQRVGSMIQTKLSKIKHDHLMLSLDKSKDPKDIIKFANKDNNNGVIVSLKLDGLTVSLTYDEHGNFIQGETRGDGKQGEDVTKNCLKVSNIPIKINNKTGKPFKVEGEIISTLFNFNQVNSQLPEEAKFAHVRNYASGSIRQLDTNVTKERHLLFIAWKNLSEKHHFFHGLEQLEDLGFDVVPHLYTAKLKDEEQFKDMADKIYKKAQYYGFPNDGLVITYNDIPYGFSLGYTKHHYRHSFAFKEQNEVYDTTLRDIEWNVGKSGICAPTAIFDEVEIDGTSVTKATAHNLSIIKQLKLGIGDKIGVIKANEIIPRIEVNYTQSDSYIPPKNCPCCNTPLITKEENNSEMLYCPNENCKDRVIAKFKQFVSKQGMNIEGLSEATLIKFYDKGYIRQFKDLYSLIKYEKTITSMSGFGKKSFTKLIESIEKSRKVKLSNYLVALSIPNIGKSAAETIHEYFHGDYLAFIDAINHEFDFTQLKDFGEIMNISLYNWALNRLDGIEKDLVKELNFIVDEESQEIIQENDFINNKTFVITGKLSQSRSVYEDFIKTNGGKLAGSVSKKTDYLVTNEQSGSSKYNKAVELGIKIINEEEFKKLCGIK